MAKKRSQPRTSRARSRAAEHNGFDPGAAHDEPEHSGTAEHPEAHDGAAAGEGMFASDGFLSRMVYTASYSVSFGLVFPVMLLARSVPSGNALVRGLTDGSHAARRAVGALYDEAALPAPESAGHAGTPAHA